MRRLALALFLLAAPAAANDGFMGLPAGGLTLQKSEAIAMLEEDLFLSLDEVRVDYVFRNVSTAPVTAQIGFPMPGLPVAVNFGDAETGYDMSDVKDLELLKFETRVEGKPVTSRPVVRAYVFAKTNDWDKQDRFRFTNGTDITAELVAAGIPLAFDANAIRAAYARLPDARKADWERRGIYTKGGDYEEPSWFLSTIFVREQTFAPGQNVRVQHRYKPYPAGFVMVSNHFAYDRQLALDTCVDKPTGRAIARVLKPQNGGIGYVIDYVVTTANTWKGPIGRFRMTVDKGNAKNIVSFCGNGVKKTGPTTFTLERRNYRPQREIKILVVKASGAN
jgi:hypothetical protein